MPDARCFTKLQIANGKLSAECEVRNVDARCQMLHREQLTY